MQTLTPFVVQVKTLQNEMQFVIQRSKDVDINQNDVNTAKNICDKISLIYSNIHEHVGKKVYFVVPD